MSLALTIHYICHTCDPGILGQLKAFVFVFALAHELAINKLNVNAFTVNSVFWAQSHTFSWHPREPYIL